ncbi:non-homologous end-joining DNA ligase [Fictibacillus aquaticus]|uniref:non-homologous end-joining DNA ligase n=1 Tax=Fictibacillus aquaticus TaxID=2021314 RepID=UPI001F0A1480|nr:non-homologous end-joining DNA ligase [Fictibacillus aquaticus]
MEKFLKPMLPSVVSSLPEGQEWIYEIKYDGYRCCLYWDENEIRMTSRRGHDLILPFPEVKDFLQKLSKHLKPELPIMLDGELCILQNSEKADFEKIQARGRMKNRDRILQSAEETPATFLAFDCLMVKGSHILQQPLNIRKEILHSFLTAVNAADTVVPARPLNGITYIKNREKALDMVKKADGEGIVAKQLGSRWQAGLRTTQWVKWKNVKKACFVVTAFDETNGFFHVGAVKNGKILAAGLFSNGLSPEEREALVQIIKNNASLKKGSLILVEPFLCVELEFLELYKNQIRHPRFSAFLFNMSWEDCTWENVIKNSTT